MRRLLGCFTVLVMLVGAFYFVRGWNGVSPWGASTGSIGQAQRGQTEPGVGHKTVSTLSQIAQNPTRFKGKRMTVKGRVRGATKIASNRNLYMLTDGDYRVLVIDDKAPPKDYWPRTVNGEVRVIGPQIGGLNYAYLVDAKPGVRIDPPKREEVEHFFSANYKKLKSGVDEALSSR
jgi:hypothetical protein